jgi:hypothetical protein
MHSCRRLAHEWEVREHAIGTPHEAEALRPLHELVAEDREKADEWGASLAKEAAAAARENDCVRMTALVKEIRALEFHSADFEQDSAVLRCVSFARESAWSVTKRAAAAARAADCATVKAADARVRELDADFHATVFVRDVAIARCLDASSSQ